MGSGRTLQRHKFDFDLAFDETHSNEHIFECIGRPLCKRALNSALINDNTSGTLFAYGQTGAGKTFSVAGSAGFVATKGAAVSTNRVLGLVQLTANALLEGIREDKYIMMSFVELYNGRLFDLLTEVPQGKKAGGNANRGDEESTPSRQEIRLLEDATGEVQILGMTWAPVQTVAEVEAKLAAGSKTRATDQNMQNDHSSRSHAILCLQIHEKGTAKKCGKVTMVDLAGNERGQDTGYNASQRVKEEARQINASLLALKECLRSLANAKGGRDTHTPFRQSKLTMLLRDSFMGANSITAMLACMTPKISACNYILDTVRYAQRAMK